MWNIKWNLHRSEDRYFCLAISDHEGEENPYSITLSLFNNLFTSISENVPQSEAMVDGIR